MYNITCQLEFKGGSVVRLLSLLVASMAIGAAMGALAVMIRQSWKYHSNRIALILFTILTFGMLGWSLWHFLGMIRHSLP